MTTPGRAKWAAIGIVVFCATLPLQWQSIVNVPGLGNLRYFHIGAIIMFALAHPSGKAIGKVVQAARPVFEAYIAFLLLSELTALGWNADWSDYAQRSVYFVFGLWGGACVLVAVAHEVGRRILFWASPLALVVFVLEFGQSMIAAGVNPVTTLEHALVSGDPTVIEFALFRRSFNSTAQSEEVRSNARHEIFGALIIVYCLSLAIGAVKRSSQIVLALSGLVTLVMLLISQSRSMMLAVALALFIAFVRVVVTRRIKTGTLFLGALIIAATIVAVPTVGKLLITRVTETKSYDARLGAFDLSSSEIAQRLTFGGGPLDTSTHNLVGDAALRGGVFTGLAAVIVVLGFTMYAVRNVRTYVMTGKARNFAALTCLSIVLVRCFTAGGGQLQQGEWFGFGLVLVIWLTRDGWESVLPPPPPPPLPPARRTPADRREKATEPATRRVPAQRPAVPARERPKVPARGRPPVPAFG